MSEAAKKELIKAVQFGPVRIPTSLIRKLKPFGPRYIKVSKPILHQDKTGKRAVEHGWQTRPYEANDAEVQRWVSAGNNYGVVCGEGLIAMDIDQECYELFPDIPIKLPETLVIQSGSGKGRHFIYRSDVRDNATILTYRDDKQINIGNIQARNKYVVGPGCNHYTGGVYKILKDLPVAWIGKEEIDIIFGKTIHWAEKQQAFNEMEAKWETRELGFVIPIKDVIDLSELRDIGHDEFQGPHPIHGSTTGVNFCVNTKKNCWHCFRCNSGGGPLSWLAIKEDLIKCEDAKRGVLRGELFWKSVKIAEQEGFDVDSEKLRKKTTVIKEWFTGSPPRFNHAKMARKLMEQFCIITRKDNKLMFIYSSDKGIYTPDGEERIKGEMQNLLEEYSTIHRQSEVINFVQNETYKEIVEAPANLVVVENGLLDIFTRQLRPFTADYFMINALPVHFNPAAKCPKAQKFVSEVVASADVTTVQKTAGYCLFREYRFHKAFMFTGDGANGKSTLINLLRAMLGDENVSTIPLQDFDRNRFAVSSLYGKMANMYPDLPDIALKKTGVFKTLTGGDKIAAEHKYRDIFFFVNYAKLVFSANKIPETVDDTVAFFRRWVILNFPNQFLADDPKTDPNILEKLTSKEELSGFLNWALEGLQKLLKDSGFKLSQTVEEIREQYIRASSPVKAFAMDCIDRKAGEYISKDELYEHFINYCREHRLPSVAKNVFSMKIPEFVPGLTYTRKRIGGKRANFWQDITFVPSDLSGPSDPPLVVVRISEEGREEKEGYENREEGLGQTGRVGQQQLAEYDEVFK
ncbi:MAG: bifunctional DNA primase/polymerase [Desulfobacterales bacterium]|nr:bifunctional DNA primase/polymerase [Desulfobacterales bacterium]